jgi:hypothetical protein
MKSLIGIRLFLLSFLLFFVSCSEQNTNASNSVETLSEILQKNVFYQESPLAESEEYSFDGSKFTLELTNKRTNEIRRFTGSYSVLSGKYSDTGESYKYVKLVYDDFDYASVGFFVFADQMLVEPMRNGKSVKSEDSHGLNIESWYISLAPDYAHFSPIKK